MTRKELELALFNVAPLAKTPIYVELPNGDVHEISFVEHEETADFVGTVIHIKSQPADV